MDDAAVMILEGEVRKDESEGLLGDVIQGRVREPHGLAILAPLALTSSCYPAKDDPIEDG